MSILICEILCKASCCCHLVMDSVLPGYRWHWQWSWCQGLRHVCAESGVFPDNNTLVQGSILSWINFLTNLMDWHIFFPYHLLKTFPNVPRVTRAVSGICPGCWETGGGKTIGLYQSDSSSSWTFQGWSAQNISHQSGLVLEFWITVNTTHLHQHLLTTISSYQLAESSRRSYKQWTTPSCCFVANFIL